MGAGEVGFHIASHLALENKDVVVLDKNPDALRRVSDNLDVQVVTGSGSSPVVLEEAGIQDAEIILAVTNSDETNLVACLVADILSPSTKKMARIRNAKVPVLLLINKIDTSDQEFLEAQVAYWQETLPKAEIFPISALEGFGVEAVMGRLLELLPEGPAYFPKDQLTDKPERFFVGEIIREKILQQYQKEVPYAVEVVTESFIEEEDLIRIGAVINVERETQKGILIGHKGSALKRVGTEARKDMEAFFGKQVFLELFVKVSKNWRSNERQLRRFGYSNK